MGSRRKAREQALQLLYQLDLHEGELEAALHIFWDEEPADADVMEFARTLVRGVRKHQGDLDEQIATASINWKVARMSYVDRNILRLAAFEFLYMDEIPTMVSLNEAIELGKRFGTTESGAFINGILDRIARNLDLTGGSRRR